MFLHQPHSQSLLYIDQSGDWVRMDWVSGEWIDWVEIFPTEEKEYKLTGMEELEVAAAILLIFLVTILTLIFCGHLLYSW